MYSVRSQKAMLSLISSPLSHRDKICYVCKNVSTDEVFSERLFALVSFPLGRTPYVQEQVNIGAGPPGSKHSWFRSVSNEPRFINTITFEKENAPTLVMVHGYGAAQGFFFRNYDSLAQQFRVLAIDQLG